MAIETHECAAEGCRTACPISHFMCVPHWRMVPASTRREIREAFRRWRYSIAKRRGRSSSQETFTNATALREAQARAIAAVREKELRKLTANPAQETFLPPPQEI